MAPTISRREMAQAQIDAITNADVAKKFQAELEIALKGTDAEWEDFYFRLGQVVIADAKEAEE